MLLCVKPRDIEPALSSIAADLTGEHVLICTAASVGTNELRIWSQRRARIVRDGALALGVSYAQAREMVAQTVLGSAQLLLAGDAHPARLRTAVATPAGRTIRGLIALEEGTFRAAVTRAVCAGSQAAERPVPATTPRSS